MAESKKRRGVTCRIHRCGTSFVMHLPHQLVKALEIKEKDPLSVKIDKDGNLIVEKYTGKKNDKEEIVHVRTIGGAKLSSGFYKQLGFTVPKKIVQEILNQEFLFPIIVEKKGDYFKLLFRRVKEGEVPVPA